MDIEYDDEAPIRIDPEIGEFEDDLDRVTDRVYHFPNEAEEILEGRITEIEGRIDDQDPDENRLRYLAVLSALHDLIEIGYKIDKSGELTLYPPNTDAYRDDPEVYKEIERQVLQKEREAQFEEDSIRRFIQKMEASSESAQQNKSIEKLIVDGEELHNDLVALADLERDDITAELEDTIQPYVQVAEKQQKDEYTGLDLMDIWRYFRYTWLTPYNTVPGRNINFLIRDAARQNDPVMGIASLASSMMNLSVRDQEIGWQIDGLEERLERKQRTHRYKEKLPKDERTPQQQTRTVETTEYLETEDEYQERKQDVCSRYRSAIETAIDQSIENIQVQDFIEHSDKLTKTHFEETKEPVFEELQRFEGLARYIIQDEPPLAEETHEGAANTFSLSKWSLEKSDLDRIWFEDEDPDNLDDWEERCETALFVKKRANTLQRLLRDRAYFDEHASEDDIEFVENALESGDGRRALKTALKEIKKRRVGAGMMNIMVCGAIPPYNEILGGKLVAMALTGPKVIESYREKYEGYESKIASSMKGEAVIKPNELVFLDTTGLFAVGSAQYDRIRIPTNEEQIEYRELGKTEGYGSIQFGQRTRQALSDVTELVEGRQVVRGRFGEGIAPRMRKIRRGLENCGLDGELLKHESPRIVYSVDLATDARDYLLGLTDNPAYVWDFEDIEQEQQQIYDHWRHRWVSKRVQKEEVLERIKDFDYREDLLLGHEITFAQRQLSDF